MTQRCNDELSPLPNIARSVASMGRTSQGNIVRAGSPTPRAPCPPISVAAAGPARPRESLRMPQSLTLCSTLARFGARTHERAKYIQR